MSFSSDQSGRILRAVTRNNTDFCSTPVVGKDCRLSSITISAVETNSSSSTKTGIHDKTQITAKNRKRQKRTRKNQRIVRNKKKRILPKSKDSDDDWETKSEESVKGDESLRKASNKIVISSLSSEGLFRSNDSPEQIREAYHYVENKLDSPILRSWRRSSLTRTKDNSEKENELLSSEHLPSFKLQNICNDEEIEDDLRLRKEDVVKTYAAPVKKAKDLFRWQKCEKWLVDVRLPTASSDLLWEDFVTKNYDEISQYLARPVDNSHRKTDSMQDGKWNIEDRVAYVDAGEEERKERKKRRKNKQTVPEFVEMEVARGSWDKSLNKWTRKIDEYVYPETDDIEFEKGGENGGRITLETFRRLRKEEREKEKLQEVSTLNATSSKNIRDVRNSKNHLRTHSYESSAFFANKSHALSRVKTDYGAVKNNSEKEGNISIDIPEEELKRINEIRRFASRLNAKNKATSFNEASSHSFKKQKAEVHGISSKQKRANVQNRNERQLDAKRQKLDLEKPSTSNKPKITSMQLLTKSRFRRFNDNWRIEP